MSYDGWIAKPGVDDGELADLGNYTSNVSGMWAEALGMQLRDTDGMDVATAAPILRAGVDAMKADPDGYRLRYPTNGWGDYDGALRYLERTATACEDFAGAKLILRWSS